VTCWGTLIQVRAAATGKARSPTMDSRVRRTFRDSEEADRSCLQVLKSAVYSSSSARYDCAVGCPMQTLSLVHKIYTQELQAWTGSSGCSQSVQLAEKRSDVVIVRRREHESRGRVRDRLELLEKVRHWLLVNWRYRNILTYLLTYLRRNASQACVAVVQSWQDEWRQVSREWGHA